MISFPFSFRKTIMSTDSTATSTQGNANNPTTYETIFTRELNRVFTPGFSSSLGIGDRNLRWFLRESVVDETFGVSIKTL